MKRTTKIRYAIVGLGHLAQVAILPAFRHARRSELAALVSGDSAKGRVLSKKYRVPTYGYDDFELAVKKERIDAAEQRAIKAIQVCEQARRNKVPEREYSKLSAAANGAILEVEQTAQTTEESIYAKEVNKTARDLYAKELRAWLAERDARNDALRKQAEELSKAQRQEMKKP